MLLALMRLLAAIAAAAAEGLLWGLLLKAALSPTTAANGVDARLLLLDAVVPWLEVAPAVFAGPVMLVCIGIAVATSAGHGCCWTAIGDC